MKKIENNFVVTGFIGKDAEIRKFTNASVARFSIAVGRSEKNGDEDVRVSAFMNVEAWRKNENTSSFEILTKGRCLPLRATSSRKNGPVMMVSNATALSWSPPNSMKHP